MTNIPNILVLEFHHSSMMNNGYEYYKIVKTVATKFILLIDQLEH
jgi:hypothetical protein